MPRTDPDNLSDRICLVPDCPKREQARGLCPKHYQRQRINGHVRDLQKPWYRFWPNVAMTDGDQCWLWVGNRNHAGYGVFYNYPGTSTLAHRTAYEWFAGPIPDGLQLDHLCRVHNCINPRHLEPVTREENMRRARGWKHPNHRNLAVTHCPKGHPYEGDNVYFNKKGHRFCKECARVWNRQGYERRKAASRG